ncbi:hypothetical protein AOLI_G00266410 [Acnodon oligacanthus]
MGCCQLHNDHNCQTLKLLRCQIQDDCGPISVVAWAVALPVMSPAAQYRHQAGTAEGEQSQQDGAGAEVFRMPQDLH